MESESIALATAVARLHVALQGVEHPELSAVGVTADQWRVLDHLVRRGPTVMSELAMSAGLTGPTTTRVADALVQAALAYRTIDPVDRRRTVLQAAKRGARLHARVAQDVAARQRAAAEAVWTGLGDSERQALRSVIPIDVA